MENRKAVIVGAGISGLCAAVELKRKGFDVLVLERQARAGGVVGTLEKDGFRAESGSNSVMVQSQKTLDFLAEMGLSDKIDYANPVSKKRFFVRYGKPRAGFSASRSLKNFPPTPNRACRSSCAAEWATTFWTTQSTRLWRASTAAIPTGFQ